jgi:tyrosyl-tRNA synthetase
MSKSKHNYVALTDAPNDMFGKIMSISDDLMWNWYDLLSLRSNEEIAALKEACQNGKNPRDAKVALAKEIVERFHSKEAADAAEAEFNNRFRHGAIPDNIQEVTVETEDPEGLPLPRLLKDSGLVPSSAEAIRNIEQGGVSVNGTKVTDRKYRAQPGDYVLQVGKRRWAKVHLLRK